jgi:hypothetical protein
MPYARTAIGAVACQEARANQAAEASVFQRVWARSSRRCAASTCALVRRYVIKTVAAAGWDSRTVRSMRSRMRVPGMSLAAANYAFLSTPKDCEQRVEAVEGTVERRDFAPLT